jgi:hypothetical protein
MCWPEALVEGLRKGVCVVGAEYISSVSCQYLSETPQQTAPLLRERPALSHTLWTISSPLRQGIDLISLFEYLGHQGAL